MRKKANAPCLKCEDRWVKDGKTCHSDCEAYKDYREHLYDIYKERLYNYEASDYTAKRQEKISKRMNLKKRW